MFYKNPHFLVRFLVYVAVLAGSKWLILYCSYQVRKSLGFKYCAKFFTSEVPDFKMHNTAFFILQYLSRLPVSLVLWRLGLDTNCRKI